MIIKAMLQQFVAKLNLINHQTQLQNCNLDYNVLCSIKSEKAILAEILNTAMLLHALNY